MVNTFVLSTDKNKLFSHLDKKRLGKQRLEAKQIINLLERYDETGELSGGFSNHPATRMWLGYTDALKVYFNLCVDEWINRGGKNTMELYDVDVDKYRIVQCSFDFFTGKAEFQEDFDEFCFPVWFSYPPLILSHLASLIRKDEEFYSQNFVDIMEPLFYGLDEFDQMNDDEKKEFLLHYLEENYYHRGYLWPHKNEEMYEQWSLDYLDPIGTGAPAKFQVSEEDARKWAENPNINPETGRSIKTGSAIYNKYKEAYEGHFGEKVEKEESNKDKTDITEAEALEWFQNPSINPKTGRKIKEGAKTYVQFQKAYSKYFG